VGRISEHRTTLIVPKPPLSFNFPVAGTDSTSVVVAPRRSTILPGGRPVCGRYTLRNPRKALDAILDLPQLPFLEPRYNIAPSQAIAVIRFLPGQAQREAVLVRWGLIPSWASDPAIGHRMINARSETAATKPAFRSAFRQRRCLAPADGFYEWKAMGGKKQPYLIRVGEDQPFAFAGLWEKWEFDGQTIESCTILTTEANDAIRTLHERMPVILAREDHGLWLDPAVKDPALLQPLLRPYSAELMNFYPVSTLVNSPRVDQPECAERQEPPAMLFEFDASR
jgi:putative SOS response-associated peptidase YedK